MIGRGQKYCLRLGTYCYFGVSVWNCEDCMVQRSGMEGRPFSNKNKESWVEWDERWKENHSK